MKKSCSGIEAQDAMDTSSLVERAWTIGKAKAIEQALQLLLPALLARYLPIGGFGEYRLFWLFAGTVVAIAPLGMPRSLFYFLPRSDAAKRRLYINQTLAFLAVSGTLGALVMGPWNPLFGDEARGLAQYGLLVPTFVVVWTFSVLIDVLPSADEKVVWQANATIVLALLRFFLIGGVAVMTGDVYWALLCTLIFATLKAALLVYYVRHHHPVRSPPLRCFEFADQLRHAIPFGVSTGLDGLRRQVDQWVVVGMFATAQFGVFSVAGPFMQLVNLFFMSVTNVFMPAISREHAIGNIEKMLVLNGRANLLIATMVFPLIGLLFFFSNEVIAVVFTRAYGDAAPVLRVYTFGMIAFVIEAGTLLLLLRMGRYVMAVSSINLAVAAVCSYLAAKHFGLVGAAAGTVVAAWLDMLFYWWRIGVVLNVPLRQLQDWIGLAKVVLSAALSAGAAAWLVGIFGQHWLALAQLSAGAALQSAIYVALLSLLGYRHLVVDFLKQRRRHD